MTGTTFDVEVIASIGGGTKRFADSAVISRRGEVGECAYMIRAGRVALRQKGRAVEMIGPGEMFGVAGLIDGQPRLTTAVAVGVVDLLPIDRQMFAVLLRDDEDFALTVMRLLARRLRATTEMFEDCVAEAPMRAEGRTSAATAA